MITDGIEIGHLMETSGVSFGTSGARGTVAAMKDRICYAYTRGFIQALQARHRIRNGDKIILSGDLRPSTPAILAAVAKAVADSGFEAVYVGQLPSPALAFYAIQHQMASIMVTGSHIPDDRNGIKFNRPDGEITKEDEELIRQQVVPLCEPFTDSCWPAPVIDQASELYRQRYIEFFRPDCLRGMHIGVYQHSGVGRDILVDILESLGAKITRLGRSDTFIPVDTEAIRDEDIALASQWSDQLALDSIVSTDGDADRPLISDEHGQWLRGDIVGVLCARYLQANAVVTPVSSNTVVEACGWFDQVLRTRIGSPYVIEAMNRLTDNTRTVVGYEANGGVLLGTDVTRDGRTLLALPTRDAVLPILSVLVMAVGQGVTIGQLLAQLPARYTSSGRLKNFPTQLAQQHISKLIADKAAIASNFTGLCGQLRQVDTTDGLRMVFENDEIIHLRPSGNAPELRCYNEAASVERANELNALCLDLLSGWR